MTPEQLKEAINIPRLKKLFVDPLDYWREVLPEPGDIRSQMVPRMLVLAALPAAGILLGNTYRLAFVMPVMGILAAIISAVLTFALNVGIWLLLGIVINQLTEAFDAQKDLGLSMKLAAGAVIPVWLGGTLWVVPFLGHVLGPTCSLAGLVYGCLLLFKGLPVVNGTPQDKALVYMVSSMAILFVLFLFLTWITFCPASVMVFSRAARMS